MTVLSVVLLALVTPGTSSHFEKFADPQSGVVSYLMRDGTFDANQQSLYFTQRSMTDDGRFLVLTTAPYEFAPEYLKKGAKVPRRLAAVDFADDSTFLFGPAGKYSIPYVDVANDAVYSVDFDRSALVKYDLRAKGSEAAAYALPKEVSDLGRVKRWYTHLTLSADRSKAFFDAGLATGEPGPERCVEGVLELATGKWTKWGEAPFVCDHGQISPVDDNLALCAMENVAEAYKKDGSYPRMWLLRPGERRNVPSKTILHATHEIWDDDGTGFYWCSRAQDRDLYGVFRYDLKSGEETCLSPMMSMHAMTSADRRYVVYDWPLPPLGRGSAWRVGFYDRETGGHAYVFTCRPAISDFAKDERSVLHPDPHPQFVMGGRYIVSTANREGRRMTLAVTPVEPLKAVTAAPCGKVERTATGVRLVRGGKTVWNFEIDADDGKPYVHPLVTPSGETLTDVRPSDHPWHKGLWFAWKFLNGANGWEKSVSSVVSKEVAIRGLGAQVRLTLTHRDAEGAALSESRTVDFLPPDESGGYAILSEHEFTALRDVTLDRTPPYARPDGAMAGGYAGLTLRLTADAAKRFAARRDGQGFVTFANPSTGESILLYAYEQPKTAKFYAWPDRRMLNLSPVWSGPVSLKAGERMRLRYAVQVRKRVPSREIEFADWPAGTDPATVSRRLSEQFLRAVPEAYKPVGCDTARASYGGGVTIMYCTASLWAHGLACARLAGNGELEKKLLEKFWPLLKEKKDLAPKPGHVDNSIFGALPLEVARLTGCKASLDLGLRYADLQWSAPDARTVNPQNFPQEEQRKLFADGYTPETRFWIDDMYMITFLQVQAYRATGDLKYLSRTAKELALYIRKLQRPDGLFDHAPGVPFVWGRGDGWVSGGLTLLMRYLPKDDPNYPAVRKGYEKMMAGLLGNQRANGLWGQLVDDPGSWDETSGSAMFAYGFVTGVRLGILDRATYAPAARKAYLALVGKLDQYGNLADVCEGTVKKNDRDHYLARPRVNGAPYGQAALMWICNALLED